MNKSIIKWLLVLAIVFVVGIASFSAGIVFDRFALHPSYVAVPAGTVSQFNLMTDAWDTVQNNYVDIKDITNTQLIYGAISGMVDALGDTGHSRFLTPEMVQQENNFTQGQFEGIGAEVQMKDGNIVIVAPIDGTPAQKAGVHPGDIIVKVNGEDITGLSLGDVVSKILGPAGTQVTITLMDPKSGQTRDLTITRAKIQLQNVTWNMLPGTHVAHLRIAAFSSGVTNDLITAIQEIRSQGGQAIILDLRNDPGGLLDEAVSVASQFLASGDVLQVRDAFGNVQSIPVKSGGLATDIPLVVLINQGTASAAEIVSGAIQDAGRAQLVGETTFGTGTVLQPFALPDKSEILLATQEWLTPKGRQIWHNGIAPDVTVTLPQNAFPLVPEGEKGMTAADIQNSQDTQLLKALDLLPANSRSQ